MTDTTRISETSMTPAPVALPWTRLFYWSVRRELWEHRAVWLVPLAVAALAVIGAMIGAHRLPDALRAAAADPVKAKALIMPFAFSAMALLPTGLLVAAFYSMVALHAERRDRSIMFWKSLPVSDLITVLSKVSVPLVIQPAVVLVLMIAVNIVVLAILTVVAAANGLDARLLWSNLPLVFMWLALARGMVIISLWYAPICAWLLLVSAWARRAPFLWAAAPFIGLTVLDRVAFGGKLFSGLLKHRLMDWYPVAFTIGGNGKDSVDSIAALDPTWLLTSPDLWLGLGLAALLITATVHIRRSRGPI